MRHLDRSYGFKTQIEMASETVESNLIGLIWCAFLSQPWRHTERECMVEATHGLVPVLMSPPLTSCMTADEFQSSPFTLTLL